MTITVGQFKAGVSALGGLAGAVPTLTAVITEGFSNLSDDEALANDIIAIAIDVDPRLALAADVLVLLEALVSVLVASRRPTDSTTPTSPVLLPGQTTPPLHGWEGH